MHMTSLAHAPCRGQAVTFLDRPVCPECNEQCDCWSRAFRCSGKRHISMTPDDLRIGSVYIDVHVAAMCFILSMMILIVGFLEASTVMICSPAFQTYVCACWLPSFQTAVVISAGAPTIRAPHIHSAMCTSNFLFPGLLEGLSSIAQQGTCAAHIQSDLVIRTLPIGALGIQQHLCWGHVPTCQYAAVPLYNNTWTQQQFHCRQVVSL